MDSHNDPGAHVGAINTMDTGWKPKRTYPNPPYLLPIRNYYTSQWAREPLDPWHNLYKSFVQSIDLNLINYINIRTCFSIERIILIRRKIKKRTRRRAFQTLKDQRTTVTAIVIESHIEHSASHVLDMTCVRYLRIYTQQKNVLYVFDMTCVRYLRIYTQQ